MFDSVSDFHIHYIVLISTCFRYNNIKHILLIPNEAHISVVVINFLGLTIKTYHPLWDMIFI